VSFFELVGLSPEAWEREQRRGAISARGYHFQDAVFAWLMTLGVTREWPVGALVPEGRDDARLRCAGALVDVQVESRQPHLPPVSRSELAGWVQTLASSPEVVAGVALHAASERLVLVLVVEHGIPMTGLDRVAAEIPETAAALRASLSGRMDANEMEALLARLHLVAIREPLDAAKVALADARG